jgi:hypothetical protein
LGADCHVTGNIVRAILPEEKQDAVLEGLKREHLRLISLTPVRTSLEDYFVAQLKPEKETAGATA